MCLVNVTSESLQVTDKLSSSDAFIVRVNPGTYEGVTQDLLDQCLRHDSLSECSSVLLSIARYLYMLEFSEAEYVLSDYMRNVR